MHIRTPRRLARSTSRRILDTAPGTFERSGRTKPRYSALALEEAKKELREAEIAAVGAGKPLPDKDEFLAPVRAKMDDYDRTVPALKALAQRL
ncbi:hypothetical protein GCM10023238_05070 [Streptomyces heliomycini]